MSTDAYFRPAALWVVLAASTGAFGATQGVARDVTFERLLAADSEPENWLMVHKNYAATRFSTLDQINRGNAANLKLVYLVGLGGTEPGGVFPNSAMEASPLVEDGFMYLADGWSHIYKVDVSKPDRGGIAWKTDPPGIDKAAVNMAASRGVALYKDMVVALTVDGHVVGVKKDDGQIVFDASVRTSPLEGFTGAPLVVKNKVMIGASGGDLGARGWLGAFDLDTHKIAWRWYAVPEPGQPGSETWKDGHDAWKQGGGAIWATGAYQPQTNRLILGTGNPNKAFDAAARAGDNLYTESTVALDADSGKLAWYFQYTPNSSYDYDEVGSQMLINTVIDGKSVPVLSHFGRNGFYYSLDANNGRFLKGDAFVSKLTWSRGLNPRTGKPLEYKKDQAVQTYALAPHRGQSGVEICPEQTGGANYWPPAFSPLTQRVYAGNWEGCGTDKVQPDNFMGGSVVSGHISGSLVSLDPSTARVITRRLADAPNCSGATATAGHLVITAFRDGLIEVLDDETLKPLYSLQVGTFIAAPPVVYAVNGKEYIGILTGGGLLVPHLGSTQANKESFKIESVPQLLVFSL